MTCRPGLSVFNAGQVSGPPTEFGTSAFGLTPPDPVFSLAEDGQRDILDSVARDS